MPNQSRQKGNCPNCFSPSQRTLEAIAYMNHSPFFCIFESKLLNLLFSNSSLLTDKVQINLFYIIPELIKSVGIFFNEICIIQLVLDYDPCNSQSKENICVGPYLEKFIASFCGLSSYNVNCPDLQAMLSGKHKTVKISPKGV